MTDTKALINRIKEIIEAHTSNTETTIGCRTEEVQVIWDTNELFDDIKQAIEAHERETSEVPKFHKEDLHELAYLDVGAYYTTEGRAYTVIENKLVDILRWTTVHSLIFKTDNGRYYMTEYHKGATELQSEQPFEDEDDMVECTEVVPTEAKNTVYVPKTD